MLAGTEIAGVIGTVPGLLFALVVLPKVEPGIEQAVSCLQLDPYVALLTLALVALLATLASLVQVVSGGPR